MAVFAEVVARGSLTGAARGLGLTPSAVSQQLRQLETELGVSLLHRSTRRLALTEAGASFHEGCAAMVAAAQSAEQALARLRDAPEGELRLAAPVGLARLIAPALAPLMSAHPGLSLRLLVDDTPIDLIEQRVDLALRVGSFADSSLVARLIGRLPVLLVAAPAYLARRGVPATPGDLLQHDWLLMQPRAGGVNAVELEREGSGGTPGSERLRPVPRALSSNQLALQHLCLAGLGLAVMVLPDIAEDLQAGRLVRVLPSWRLADYGVHAVTPTRDAQPAKVRHAIEALRLHLGTEAGAGLV